MKRTITTKDTFNQEVLSGNTPPKYPNIEIDYKNSTIHYRTNENLNPLSF